MIRSQPRWLVWQVLVLLLVVTILLGEFMYMSGVRFLSDEGFNFRQITRYIHGDFSFEPGINMIPGYHALVALALRSFNKAGAFSARFVSVWAAAAPHKQSYARSWGSVRKTGPST